MLHMQPKDGHLYAPWTGHFLPRYVNEKPNFHLIVGSEDHLGRLSRACLCVLYDSIGVS